MFAHAYMYRYMQYTRAYTYKYTHMFTYASVYTYALTHIHIHTCAVRYVGMVAYAGVRCCYCCMMLPLMSHSCSGWAGGMTSQPGIVVLYKLL